MNKNLLFNGFKMVVAIGMLLSLVLPAAALAQIPVEYNTQSLPIVENIKPTAVADNYTLEVTETIKFLEVPAALGVLVNDSDPDGDPITAVSPTQPANGSVILYSNGSFKYTPNVGFTGQDKWTYKASDGTLTSNPALVTITVSGGNTAPVANEDNYSTAVDVPLTVAAPGVLGNDTDAEDDTLSAYKIADPAHGTVNLSTLGGFTYTPQMGYSGEDYFTYEAFDGTSYSTPARVVINVTGGGNTAPDANADSYVTDMGVPLVKDALTGVLANDFDIDGDTLTAILWVAPINGSLTLQPDGSFTYTPLPGYYGDDHFTYKAFDGVLESDPAMVTITVNPINIPPVAAADTYATPMGTTLTVDALTGVLANDYDFDLDLLSAELVGFPMEFGILNLSSNGSFTYIPTPGLVGTVYFTYKAYDGIDYSDPVQVTIEVEAINTAPVATADSYVMLMDTTLSVNAVDGVLANDTDVDVEDTLIAEFLGMPVVNGQLHLYTNGAFVFEPNDGFYGTTYFTYKAYDGLAYSEPALVTLTVKQSNLAPIGEDDAYEMLAGGTLTVLVADGVLDNDTDPDGDTLEAVLTDDVGDGLLNLHADGSFTYVPEADFTGVDSFRYQAFDGLSVSGEILVTITVGEEVNMAPVAVADTYVVRTDTTLSIAAPGVLANDYDANYDDLTAQLGVNVTHGTLSLHSNGSFTYTPAAGFIGVDQFTYRASDGVLSSLYVIVTITVVTVTHIPLIIK